MITCMMGNLVSESMESKPTENNRRRNNATIKVSSVDEHVAADVADILLWSMRIKKALSAIDANAKK
jgi:hypothetical protein